MKHKTLVPIVMIAVSVCSTVAEESGAPGDSGGWPMDLPAPRALESIYVGDDTLRWDLRIGAVRPLSLAATDLNGDGVDDLIVGHGGRTELLTVHFGNLYAVYPHSAFTDQREMDPLFDDGPFMRTAQVLAAPSRPDFLAVGDFNNDGFSDVVLASRGEDGLHLLAGDGTGGLRPASTVRLSGLVSTMISGEINRPDGLADLVVAISEPQGHAVVVYEHPQGALSGEPERMELPAGATSLALERLDDDPFVDLTIGAGQELVVVHGRDRRLSLSESTRRQVRPAFVETLGFAGPIATPTNANLAMRLGPDALTDLVTVHDGSLAVAQTAPVAMILVNSTDDTLIAGDGACTLREAITNANANTDTTAGDCASGVALDQIAFSIDGSGSNVTVSPASPLPPIADPVVIDGNTQGCTVLPCVELNGTLAGSTDVDGLQLEAGGNTIRGLAINRFSRSGIRITSDGNFIEGNFIGTDYASTADLGNGAEGVIVVGASNNTIGGTTSGARNVISGNVAGVDLRDGSTANRIIGNYIGTERNGLAPLGNTRGVYVLAAAGNTIGGVNPGEGNLISGNGPQGISVWESDGTVIQGNLIGVNASGSVAVPNNSVGVFIVDTADATIGGTAVGAGNVISGNGLAGLAVREINGFPTTRNTIQGNFIGTDENGTIALPNGAYGIFIAAKDNIVGGAGTARNVISANGNHGIYIVTAAQQLPPSEGNQVLGNYIGTDVSGTVPLGNTGAGVSINDASGNTIGGVTVGEGNVIAHNQAEGIVVQGDAPDNMVTGNRIFSNGQLGIDLGADGVTPNDLDDPDVGPNALQNFPVLSVAVAGPAELLVEGSVNSIADSSFRVELFANSTCDDSQHGEGERFLAFTDVTTTAAGIASFSVVLPAWINDGDAIVATATSDAGSTSEFGACLVASCASILPFPQTMLAPNKYTFAWSIPAEVRYASGDLARVSSYAVSKTATLFGATRLSILTDATPPGFGLFYLVKSLGCGTWQTTFGNEPGRDPGLP